MAAVPSGLTQPLARMSALPGAGLVLSGLLGTGVPNLPGAGLFSLSQLLQNLLTKSFLPASNEGRLPLLSGFLPALPEELSGVTEAALARAVSSLRLTGATHSGPAGGERVEAMASAGSRLWDDARVAVVVASLCATALWRVCATC